MRAPSHTPFMLYAVAIVGIVGCERPTSDQSRNGPSEVRLGYFANVTHAQAALGVASGDFAKAAAPARFSTRVFNAGPSLIEALLTGNIDIGYVGPSPALNAHDKSRGRGVRVISGSATNGVIVVARKDSGITSLKDLVGKRLATPQHGNTQDIAARYYLTKVLGQKDASTIIPVPNAEQASMMTRNEIDAAWTPEPWGSRLIIENGATLVAEEKDLWPNKRFVLTVIVTTPEFLARHPDFVKKMLGVHVTWTQRLQADSQQYATQLGDALYAVNQKRLPEGVLLAALRNVEFTLDPLDETFQTMGQWAYDLGFARNSPKLEGLIDTTLLQQVRQPASEPSVSTPQGPPRGPHD